MVYVLFVYCERLSVRCWWQWRTYGTLSHIRFLHNKTNINNVWCGFFIKNAWSSNYNAKCAHIQHPHTILCSKQIHTRQLTKIQHLFKISLIMHWMAFLFVIQTNAKYKRKHLQTFLFVVRLPFCHHIRSDLKMVKSWEERKIVINITWNTRNFPFQKNDDAFL